MDYEFFMQKALSQAKCAFDQGEFPVGCILVYENTVIAEGFRTGTANQNTNETDHAEMTVIRRMGAWADGVDPDKAVLFSTLEPCLMCLGAIILNGIGKVVYAYEDVLGGGASCDLSRLPSLYARNPISIVPHVMRKESLTLFKAYFKDPQHHYWRGSLLAEYTLRQ